MDMVRVFGLTSISTLVRMCTGLVSVKVVAAIIGPAGVALVGQLSNFSSMLLNFSNGCINTGVTKYLSEFKEEKDAVAQYLSTALRITVLCSLICGISLIVLHSLLSELIMQSRDYGYVFVIFGITILLYGLNNLLLSVVNGFKEFRRYVYINIANSIVGVTFTVLLVLTWGLEGALISAVTYQSVMLFITLWILRKTPWLRWSNFSRQFSKFVASRYFKFALMSLTSVICVPISQMLLRGYVMAEISDVEAGLWEGMNRISAMYLMVITSSFTVYYLPRLSEITDPLELRREIYKSYAIIVPALIAGFALIYLLRFFIIKLLFTPEFVPMQSLFIWQLLGDFFKICSWLLAFLMVAKAMAKAFITTEIVFTLIYIAIGFLLIHLNGIVGLCQAYLANYILYSIAMLLICKKIFTPNGTFAP